MGFKLLLQVVASEMLSPHGKGVLIGLSAVLCGSPCVIFIRILSHSDVWTLQAFRSVAQLAALLVTAAALWGRSTPRHLHAIGGKGALACFFLAGQDFAITAGFLLTTASNVTLIISTSPVFCALMDRCSK